MDAPPQRTLMEKWKEHYNTKDEIFKISPERANKVGLMFIIAFVPTLTYTAVTIMIPQLTRYESQKQYWMKTLAWFLFAQVVVNWFLTLVTGFRSQASDKTVPQNDNKLVTSLPEGWKSCPTCQLDVPPRSHHCKTCQVCVLKRDHHCFFTGSCIGFTNQRRFIVFNFWGALGDLYGIILIFRYLSDPMPFFSRHMMSYFLPVTFGNWLFGSVQFGHFMLVIMLHGAFISFFGCLWFFIWEMIIAFRGQTSYEATHNIQRFRADTSTNLKSAFGPFWILNFIIPLPTAQYGDGVNWVRPKGDKGR